MSAHVLTEVSNQTGFIILNRAPALNSLSLQMVRTITGILLAWRADPKITAKKLFVPAAIFVFFIRPVLHQRRAGLR